MQLRGKRFWSVCPGVVNGVRCGRRVAILYGQGKYFLCRHCYDLRYESQRRDKAGRALRRAQKIRQRLGGSANMTEPFPEKPQGMPHDTYMKLFWEHHEAEMKHLAAMREWLDKLERQIRSARKFVRQFRPILHTYPILLHSVLTTTPTGARKGA